MAQSQRFLQLMQRQQPTSEDYQKFLNRTNVQMLFIREDIIDTTQNLFNNQMQQIYPSQLQSILNLINSNQTAQQVIKSTQLIEKLSPYLQARYDKSITQQKALNLLKLAYQSSQTPPDLRLVRKVFNVFYKNYLHPATSSCAYNTLMSFVTYPVTKQLTDFISLANTIYDDLLQLICKKQNQYSLNNAISLATEYLYQFGLYLKYLTQEKKVIPYYDQKLNDIQTIFLKIVKPISVFIVNSHNNNLLGRQLNRQQNRPPSNQFYEAKSISIGIKYLQTITKNIRQFSFSIPRLYKFYDSKLTDKQFFIIEISKILLQDKYLLPIITNTIKNQLIYLNQGLNLSSSYYALQLVINNLGIPQFKQHLIPALQYSLQNPEKTKIPSTQNHQCTIILTFLNHQSKINKFQNNLQQYQAMFCQTSILHFLLMKLENQLKTQCRQSYLPQFEQTNSSSIMMSIYQTQSIPLLLLTITEIILICKICIRPQKDKNPKHNWFNTLHNAYQIVKYMAQKQRDSRKQTSMRERTFVVGNVQYYNRYIVTQKDLTQIEKIYDIVDQKWKFIQWGKYQMNNNQGLIYFDIPI